MHLPLINDLRGRIPHNGTTQDGSPFFVHPSSQMPSPTYTSPTFEQVTYNLQKVGLHCDLQSEMFHYPSGGHGLGTPFSLSFPSCLDEGFPDSFTRRRASFDMSPTSSTSSDLDSSVSFSVGRSSIASFVATRSRVVRVGFLDLYSSLSPDITTVF
jgi:hypothetical protein